MITVSMDSFLKLQNEDGSFPRKFKDDFSIVVASGGSTPSATFECRSSLIDLQDRFVQVDDVDAVLLHEPSEPSAPCGILYNTFAHCARATGQGPPGCAKGGCHHNKDVYKRQPNTFAGFTPVCCAI